MPGGIRPPKEDLIKVLPLKTEQKVLRVTIGLTLLATLILVIALATDYWLILTVIGKPHKMANGNLLVGSHSGLWRACLDIEEAETKAAITNCTNLFDLMEDADKAKKQKETITGGPGVVLAYAKSYIAMSFIALVFLVLALLFAFWAQQNQRYVIKRITAVLLIITAICVFVSIQVLENSTESKEQYTGKIERLAPHNITHRYGFSYVLAWIPVVFFAVAALVFLLTSKKRVGNEVDGEVIVM